MLAVKAFFISDLIASTLGNLAAMRFLPSMSSILTSAPVVRIRSAIPLMYSFAFMMFTSR